MEIQAKDNRVKNCHEVYLNNFVVVRSYRDRRNVAVIKKEAERSIQDTYAVQSNYFFSEETTGTTQTLISLSMSCPRYIRTV